MKLTVPAQCSLRILRILKIHDFFTNFKTYQLGTNCTFLKKLKPVKPVHAASTFSKPHGSKTAWSTSIKLGSYILWVSDSLLLCSNTMQFCCMSRL